MAGADLQGGLMRTALSSAVAPRASLNDLLAGLARHGLDALELRMGDQHTLDASANASTLTSAKQLITSAGAQVVGFLDELGTDPQSVAGLVHAFDSRLLLGTSLPIDQRLESARKAKDAGIPVAIVVGGTNAAQEAAQVKASGYSVVWEAHPALSSLGDTCQAVMQASGDSLVGVRLCGGGPESQLHEGRGIGTLMAKLALSGYTGFLSITPSDRKYHILWETWLGRRGGWGCGSKASTPVEPLQRAGT